MPQSCHEIKKPFVKGLNRNGADERKRLIAFFDL
nr:MAG TPA: hypothetical protein [Caudoviricetes sp.]